MCWLLFFFGFFCGHVTIFMMCVCALLCVCSDKNIIFLKKVVPVYYIKTVLENRCFFSTSSYRTKVAKCTIFFVAP